MEHLRVDIDSQVGAAIEQVLREQLADLVLLDCLTLLASNVLLQLPEAASERDASAALLTCRVKFNAHWIIVSNEVGLGLVPPYPLGRIYRDVLDRANQKLAAADSQALLLVAGMPINLQLCP